jgi:hypothetical protein
MRAVPFGVLGDAIDFRFQLLEFTVEKAAIHVIIGVVRRLNRQLAHAL